MKVAIIGYGFVGKALKNGLKNSVEVLLVDPKLNTNINDLKTFKPDTIFICVPTPMNNDGSQDTSILENVINELNSLSESALIVLKSTVIPSYISKIEIKIPNIVYNPEFLRENFANYDFINADLIVFGGKNDDANKKLANFYSQYTKCINTNYQFTDLISASLIKYSINTFLSAKVIFFNELFEVFSNSGSKDNWENFIKIMQNDKRIGNSHMQVPGPDGKLGFGGPCFPKDTKALLQYSNDIGEPLKLLEKCISLNNNIRSQYNSLSKREVEQNINFNSNISDNNKEIK
jgi:UDPglucose 6-dehydrogenase